MFFIGNLLQESPALLTFGGRTTNRNAYATLNLLLFNLMDSLRQRVKYLLVPNSYI